MISEKERRLTTQEVAERLRLSKQTICKMAKRKQLTGFKAGKEWRFKPEAITAFETNDK